jgi:hypothetical protein
MVMRRHELPAAAIVATARLFTGACGAKSVPAAIVGGQCDDG